MLFYLHIHQVLSLNYVISELFDFLKCYTYMFQKSMVITTVNSVSRSNPLPPGPHLVHTAHFFLEEPPWKEKDCK